MYITCQIIAMDIAKIVAVLAQRVVTPAHEKAVYEQSTLGLSLRPVELFCLLIVCLS
jgi:hypothetical protein